MAIIVIGGQCSKVGKTAVGCAFMSALPEWKWTAIKISPHDHTSAEASFAVEQTASSKNDTGRYLLAGAEKAILISGNMADALSGLRDEIQTAKMTLIESNHVLEFIQPDILLFVIDPDEEDCKASALRWIPSSDALLVRSEKPDPRFPESTPRFVVGPADWAPAELIVFLHEKFRGLPD